MLLFASTSPQPAATVNGCPRSGEVARKTPPSSQEFPTISLCLGVHGESSKAAGAARAAADAAQRAVRQARGRERQAQNERPARPAPAASVAAETTSVDEEVERRAKERRRSRLKSTACRRRPQPPRCRRRGWSSRPRTPRRGHAPASHRRHLRAMVGSEKVVRLGKAQQDTSASTLASGTPVPGRFAVRGHGRAMGCDHRYCT